MGTDTGRRRLEPQAHGGALQRGGRPPGARNRVRLPTLSEVVKPAHVRKAWRRLVELINDECPAIGLRACVVVLEFAVGRPAQVVDLDVSTAPAPPPPSAAHLEALERVDALLAAADGDE